MLLYFTRYFTIIYVFVRPGQFVAFLLDPKEPCQYFPRDGELPLTVLWFQFICFPVNDLPVTSWHLYPRGHCCHRLSLWNDPDVLFGFLVWFGPLYICVHDIRTSNVDQMEPDGCLVQRAWVLWRALAHGAQPAGRRTGNEFHRWKDKMTAHMNIANDRETVHQCRERNTFCLLLSFPLWEIFLRILWLLWQKHSDFSRQPHTRL